MSYNIKWSDVSLEDGKKVEKEDALLNAISFLFSVSKGDIIFRPYIGSDIEDLLFEIEDEYLEEEILDIIMDTIEKFDPRIVVDRNMSKVELHPDEHLVLVTLYIKEITGNNYVVEFPIKY